LDAGKRITKNTLFLYGRTAITMFLSLYSTRIVLNALGASDFGVFSIVGGMIALLGFLNASMTAATQRFINYAEGNGDKERVSKIFNNSVVLHGIIAIVVFLALEIVGVFFFKKILNIPVDRVPTAKLIYQFMILSTVFNVLSVPYDAVINAHEHMFLYAILGVVEAVADLLIALSLLVISSDKLFFFGLLNALLAIVLLLVRRIYCQKKYSECRLSLKTKFDKKLLKQLGSFGAWSLLGSSTSMITYYGQGIVINVFFGTVVNAAQGVAAQINGQLSVLGTNMLRALNPNIDKSEGAGDRSKMLRTSMAGSKFSFILMAIIFIPFMVEMPLILKLWLKNIPQYTIIFCQLLLSKTLIEQLFITLWGVIIAVGNIRHFQIVSSIINLFPLPICYLLFYWGLTPTSLYYTFIGFAIIQAMVMLYCSHKVAGLDIHYYFTQVILRCILFSVWLGLLCLLPTLIMQDGILRIVVVSCTGFSGSLIGVWFVILNKQEKEYITALSKNFRLNKLAIFKS
jgi:O-antigen/teichoic acid export membrane protein